MSRPPRCRSNHCRFCCPARIAFSMCRQAPGRRWPISCLSSLLSNSVGPRCKHWLLSRPGSSAYSHTGYQGC
uniref:Uncharacterized protein n=2 Tax=Arundo donax TaxID=35708 RepID=A0A0A9SVM9_ARUDO